MWRRVMLAVYIPVFTRSLHTANVASGEEAEEEEKIVTAFPSRRRSRPHASTRLIEKGRSLSPMSFSIPKWQQRK